MNDAEFWPRLTAAAASVDGSRWELAALAAECKRDKYPQWAEKIGQHPQVRRKGRTVYEWAQTAEFRSAIADCDDHVPNLPFSFYAAAVRRLDVVPFSTLVELLYTAQDAGTGLDEFRAELSTQAGKPSGPTFADLRDGAVAAVRAAWVKADTDAERGDLRAAVDKELGR